MLPHYSTSSRFLKRFWSKVAKSDDGCWLWTGYLDTDGYGMTSHGTNYMNLKVHRISWELAYGPIPKGLCCCHHCDNRSCVRPDHLFIGTDADNLRDMRDKGRGSPPPYVCGEQVGTSKLTADAVRSMRIERAAGARPVDLAKVYGVDACTITKVCLRQSWKHVE